ncbi:MAG TPA: hypothetical protein VNF04_09635 [Stellaceae bacterium]|nr:hypothetical protein [Stellaceae bacterium]
MSAQVKQRQNGVVDTILVNEHAKTPLRNPHPGSAYQPRGMTDRPAVDTLRHSSEGYDKFEVGDEEIRSKTATHPPRRSGGAAGSCYPLCDALLLRSIRHHCPCSLDLPLAAIVLRRSFDVLCALRRFAHRGH